MEAIEKLLGEKLELLNSKIYKIITDAYILEDYSIQHDIKQLKDIQELLKMLILATKETYTLNEVATLTGFKKSYLYNKISRNEIPFYKPTNGQVFIDKEDLTQWLKQNKMEVKEQIS